MSIQLPRLAVLKAQKQVGLKSVRRTAKVGSYEWTGRKVSVELPALAVLKGWVFSQMLVGLKSVRRTAKVGSSTWTVRKVSVELPALAVLMGAFITANASSYIRTFLCGHNCQRWQF